MKKQNYKCPCCGKQTLTSERMFDICPNCGWEDDNIQFSDPNYYGGANWFSLNKYRSLFLKEKNIERVKEMQEESLNKFKEDSKASIAKERLEEIKNYKNTDFSDCPVLTQEQLSQLRPCHLESTR